MEEFKEDDGEMAERFRSAKKKLDSVNLALASAASTQNLEEDRTKGYPFEISKYGEI